MSWTEWANDVVWTDEVPLNCECGFDDTVFAECEGNGERWSAYVVCPDCGDDRYVGSN